MKKLLVTGLSGLAAAAVVLGAGSAAQAQTNNTSLPGGDVLSATLATSGGWYGITPSCIQVNGDVTLYGYNPYYANEIDNTTTITAFGAYPDITWRGVSRSGGRAETSVTDSVHESYDWRADLDGPACISLHTGYINGTTSGQAYVPSQGGWYYVGAGMN